MTQPLNISVLPTKWATALIGFVGMICIANLSTAQQSELSPYSRYGFGLVNQLHSPVFAGLGGMETTLFNGYQFQPNNPASATFLSQTTFQASGIGNRLSLEQGDAPRAMTSFGSPGPIGMVVKRQSGDNALILNLSPYSTTGYVITRNSEVSEIGSVQERYEGNGGLNNFNIGWAHVSKGTRFVMAGPNDSILVQNGALHMGIQTQYLFGQLSRSSTLDILDPTFLDHQNRFTAQHRSISTTVGLVYDQLISARYSALKDFGQSYSIRLGGTYTPETNLHSTIQNLDETTQTLGGISIGLDTAFYSERVNFRGRMPQSYAVGSSLHFDRSDGLRWALGFEYKSTRWDQVSDRFAPEMQSQGVEWAQSKAYRFGFQFNRGNPEQLHPTWGKATYRLGVSQQFQPYLIDGSQVMIQAFSGGLTIPLVGSRSLSRIHFGTELGERMTAEGALEERYLRIHLGVSLMPFFKNNWLIPRLYD